jgi:hypothetical protein
MDPTNINKKRPINWTAIAAVGAATATLVSVVAFSFSVYESVQETRAYLGTAVMVGINPITISVTNYGKTPAYNVSIHTTILYGDNQQNASSTGTAHEILNPGETYEHVLNGVPQDELDTLSGIDTHIEYTDYIGQNRSIDVTYVYQGQGIFILENKTSS